MSVCAKKIELGHGQRKSINTDRVVFVPGPRSEIKTIRAIFSMFVHERKTEYEIAKTLNRRKIPNHMGFPWKNHTIKRILTNEKYIGNYVWNKKSNKLKRRIVRNDPASWVRLEGAFEPLVEKAIFEAAQKIYMEKPVRTYRGRPRGLSDEEMLNKLGDIFRIHGKLSRKIIDSSPDTPSLWSYQVRFGKIVPLYERVGYQVPTKPYVPESKGKRTYRDPRKFDDSDMLDSLRRVLSEKGYLSATVINATPGLPTSTTFKSHFGSLQQAYDLIGYKRPYRTRPTLTHDKMLDSLRRLMNERGALSRRIIDTTDGMPSAATYCYRFGNLTKAYELVDFKPIRKQRMTTRAMTNAQMLQCLRRLREDRGYLTERLIDATSYMPCSKSFKNRFGSIRRAYKLIGYVHVDFRERARSSPGELVRG
jgi:hypothetical protein